jgi:uracil-DNA glycosylase
MNPLQRVIQHQTSLQQCSACADMIGPVITGNPVVSPVLLIGQAPGDKEGTLRRPFAWTAGKTLFKWFEQIGLEEAQFRNSVYMSAICRCFPGKNPKGGDRVPSDVEIAQCARWLDAEFDLLKPELVIPVGKLAISRFIKIKRLNEIIGQQLRHESDGLQYDLIPLPHPSGASTWHRTEPGKTLLAEALTRIQRHPAWQAL